MQTNILEKAENSGTETIAEQVLLPI